MKRLVDSDWFCMVGWAATALLILGGYLFAN